MNRRRALVGIVCVSLAATLVPLLASAASNDTVDSSAEVSNEPPTNLVIEIANDADESSPGVQIAPDASGTTRILLVGRAEDGNGWKDLKKATFEVFTPDGDPVTGADGSAEAEGKGRKRSFSFTIDLSSQSPPGDYTVRMTALDNQDAARIVETTFHFDEHLALSLDEGQLSFGGGLGPGQSTHSSPATIKVNNLGNVPLDILVSASALRQVGGDATIGADRLRYASTSTMEPETALSTEGVWDTSFDVLPGASRPAYLDVHMPTGDEQFVPPGRYTGTITFGGAAG